MRGPVSAGLDEPGPGSSAGARGQGGSPPALPAPPALQEPDRRRQRRDLARLVAVLAAGITAAALTGTIGTVAVVLALVAMIMLHELGHFVTAKRAGMKVTEYFLGFGPRLWSVRRGETEYGVKAIPAGGYVRIIGMTNLDEVDPADEPRSYRQQSFGRRLSVAVAGSVVHFILAFVLLWALLVFIGQPDTSKAVVGGFSTLASGASPAEQAGFKKGDVIVSVDGRRVDGFDSLASKVRASAGNPLTLGVERAGREVTLHVTPVNSRTDPLKGQRRSSGPPVGMIGVLAGVPPNVPVNAVHAVGSAVAGVGQYSWDTLRALGGLVTPHGISAYSHEVAGGATSQPSPGTPRFLSPVGIVRLTSQAAHSSIGDVLRLLVLINVFVGLFNMLPMLPLDGGHVAIAVYERARSRRGRAYHVDAAKLLPATYVVFLALIFLGVTALYLDVSHPLANPFQ
jgi:membrane-associated protease RseP (regulator of RpoE activity)